MKAIQSNEWRNSTLAVHAGEERWKYAYSIATPITQTSTFVFPGTKEIKEYTHQKKFRYEYARYGTPTEFVAEKKLAALEGAESAILFSSGMNALTSTFLSFLQKNDHLIITHDIYKKTLQFCLNDLTRFGISTTVVRVGNYQNLEKVIRKETRMIFTESPTNPYLYVADLPRLVKIARKYNLILVVDSTIATPINQRPLDFGVDLVVHSATKYLGGHNDLLGGAVCGSEKLIAPIRDFQKTTGGNIDPFTSYLLIRSLKTLPLRIQHQNSSALQIANFLKEHPKIQRVYYPALPGHPTHRIAKSQMKGYGGMISFDIKGGLREANRFLNRLKLCYIGPSFGGSETLITHPATVTYYDLTRKERYQLGITDSLIRLAVGLEDPMDIIADLDQALTGA